MDKEIIKLLKDVIISIDTIESYIGSKKIFIDYNSSLLLQDAVERNIITIGEVMNILLKRIPEIPITNARKAVNARNRLTHGYDDIDNSQVWNIVINHLPILKTEVEGLLNETKN